MCIHFTYIIFMDGSFFFFVACYYVDLDINEKTIN
jgi:hypothetical protein